MRLNLVLYGDGICWKDNLRFPATVFPPNGKIVLSLDHDPEELLAQIPSYLKCIQDFQDNTGIIVSSRGRPEWHPYERNTHSVVPHFSSVVSYI